MLKPDQAPPFSVPLRFFLTAPVFALLAALVALWQGPALFESRWSPAALAVTHLLTLGVLGMVMLGATMQVLPVLASAPVARGARAPNVRQYLEDAKQRRQLWLHLAALALLVGAAAAPTLFAYPAALAFAVSALHRGRNLFAIALEHRKQAA